MKTKSRIIIAGAGEAGRMLAAEFMRRGEGNNIIGFLDDDESKAGKNFEGVDVIGTVTDIESVLKSFHPAQIIIAMPSVDHELINGIITKILGADPSLNIHILPSVERFFDSSPLVPALQNLTIENIMERPEYSLDMNSIMQKFALKTILITGAGGSIGSEICRQLLKFNVKRIIALGRGEASIYNLIKSMDEYTACMENKPEMVYRIADVKDRALLGRIFSEFRPDYVFHAAAHKHVPLMEYNEIEAVQNNVGGTLNILDVCAEYSVDEFVLVSTDKAVRPVNIMGATKRMTEILTGYYNRNHNLKTAIVRFGNVIGSRGSVVPLFMDQIRQGGPVTVTHPEVTRYFMSIPEASLLVINAAAYAKGGELFALDMGSQYKIEDIARKMISFYGFTPGRDIKIEYTGLRPGEKMYEELFYSKENLTRTSNEKIFMLPEDNFKLSDEMVEDFIHETLPCVASMDSLVLREMLKKFVPEYDFSSFEKEDYSKVRLVN